MKYSKRYIVFGVLVAAMLIFKLELGASGSGTVENFRGANLQATTWNPLIASSVNDNLLSLVIDNKEYTNEHHTFYMYDQLNIMVPVNILRDALNCSAHVYDGKRLLVEKHANEVEFSLGASEAKVNGTREVIVSPFIRKDDTYYVSLNDLANYLDYSYSWDIQENQLPEEKLQFSVDHMTMNNGFTLTQDDGGEYTMGMAYLAAWEGPVYEADDPYGDNKTNPDLTAVKHVQEMQIIDGKDYEKIKESVFLYGGVQTSIYNGLRSSQSKSPYYNQKTNSYCYIGTEKPNHDVVIIGWDDSYSKENFNVDLEGDGAFICQNSWGDTFGEDGVFYISYYDTNIGTHNVVYTKIEEPGNYDHIYQSDLCGWVGQLGYNKDSAYGANVYTTSQEEELVAAGFYATGKDSQYELYVVRNFENADSLTQRIPVASGKLSNAGYYTVDFNQAISLDAGERYAIVLHMITPGSVHPMAIEYAADEATANVILDDGESYISTNGARWDSVDTVEECNLCIKAFSKNR